MAMTAADPVFVDTNGLVYVSRPSAPQHIAAQQALGRLEAAGGPLWISRQVLREHLAVVTRPQATAPALPMAEAIEDVRRFQAAFEVAEDGPVVFERLLQLLGAHSGSGKQVHDANLVASMLASGIHRLLTFNTSDFQRFAGSIALEPLGIP